MADLDRRRFLQLGGGALAASTLLGSIERAAALPANSATRSIRDIEHIVVLMQENRSFDQYFGTMRGVRGFGDPRAVTLPNGKRVWQQPDGHGGSVVPFRPDAPDLGLQFISDVAHDWNSGHAGFNNGNYDQWIPAKTSTAMVYYDRTDIPFHYALADAFTVCDAYHCSLLGPTDPNRYYMWTGYTGNDGSGGGPVIANDEAGYSWGTYPERLEAAGISWHVYQDIGLGLDAAHYWGWTFDPCIGNYGDNSLLYFNQYRTATPGSPLYDHARTGTNVNVSGGLFDILRADVQSGNLPQISWIVGPEAYTEHPNWPPNYGAWYIAQALDALTSNPEVWSKTALFITYDENGGFFDHMVPPYPPSSPAQGASTADVSLEIYPGSSEGVRGPYGLGQRVPMIVVSPWSKGGFVCSQVFDHTSIVQFMERRFHVTEPNISPWRRAICGDLTAAFDFSRSTPRVPNLPDTSSYPPPNHNRHPSWTPPRPTTLRFPTQESGTKPARALPYRLGADGAFAGGQLTVALVNSGAAGAAFQMRSRTDTTGPWTYTVGSGQQLSGTFTPTTSSYDYTVYGPSGFMRAFRGSTTSGGPEIVTSAGGSSVTLTITNHGPATSVSVTDRYRGVRQVYALAAGATRICVVDASSSAGWYDVFVTSSADATYARQLTGHLETGAPSTSDPRMGAV